MNSLGYFLIVMAYFCGSIPFGLLIGKWHGIDIRTVGSKNSGATNVGRTLGRKWGILCFLLDMLKGFVPVMLAGIALNTWGMLFVPTDKALVWLGVCAATVVGHVFSIWLKYKGGKGVATALGTLLGVWPVITLPGLSAFLIWLVVLGISRYVSVASMIASSMAPVMIVAFLEREEMNPMDFIPFIVMTSTLTTIILVSHRGNIVRLFAGTEKRVELHLF